VPELPEVEVLRRSLAPRLQGDVFNLIEVYNPALREQVDGKNLGRSLEGRRVLTVGRRAKYLLVSVEGGQTLVVHLGMSGRLTLADAGAARELHEHAAFYLTSGRKLRFRDPRRFGLLLALPTSGLPLDRHFSRLGEEPVDESFSATTLTVAARGRRVAVKSFLMDPTVVVGVGNIYACETLFRAGVHPLRSVARISERRWERIAVSLVEVLQAAITEGGTTLNDFVDASGDPGYFQVSLSVYGREGEPCHQCDTAVRKKRQQGRSTYYCARCQT